MGRIFISRTTKDLRSLGVAREEAKAKGFVERSGMVAVGALPASAFDPGNLGSILDFSAAEKQVVTGWSSPEGWGHDGNRPPTARGRFLIKVGNRPGIPLQTRLATPELPLPYTNRR